MEDTQQYGLQFVGLLKGHGGWVTTIECGEELDENNQKREFLISGSRDRTIIKWELQQNSDDNCLGVPKKLLTGHSHFVSEIKLSQDYKFLLSCSWDGQIRIWKLETGTTFKTLNGHTKDVYSVDFSPDNRQIVSGGLDKQLKIWNVQGVCKFTVDQNAHTEAVNQVKYYHDTKTPIVISGGWDKVIKVWDNTTMSLMHTFVGHRAQITSLNVAPTTQFLASGSRDGKVNIWNLIDGRHLEEIDCDSPINPVIFAKKVYWLIIATEKDVRIHDLPQKKLIEKIEIRPSDDDGAQKTLLSCISLCWSRDEQTLYTGWNDGNIRGYRVQQK